MEFDFDGDIRWSGGNSVIENYGGYFIFVSAFNDDEFTLSWQGGQS